MAFPTISISAFQGFASSATHNVTMPATVDAGDLLGVWFISDDGGVTITNPGGWTQAALSTASTSTQGRVILSLKLADGTEDGTNVNFATSSARVGGAIVFRIPASSWYGDISTGVSVSNTTIPVTALNTPGDPASVTASWGSADNLYVVLGALADDPVDYSAAPTNYTGLVTGSTGVAATACGAGVAYRNLAASSDDPSGFTQTTPTTFEYNTTIVIRPSAGGAVVTPGLLLMGVG